MRREGRGKIQDARTGKKSKKNSCAMFGFRYFAPTFFVRQVDFWVILMRLTPAKKIKLSC
jgi:hypothetical protein